jgi:hypothetical protein
VNWEAIGAVGEILGAIGVIATLGYLAAQIRQNTRSSKEAASRASFDTVNRINLLLVENPEVAELASDPGDLDGAEALRFTYLMMSTFLMYQDMYFHARRSEIEPHLWHTTEAGFEPVLRAPGMWSWWESNQWRFAPEFVEYVKARRAEAKTRRGDVGKEPSS